MRLIISVIATTVAISSLVADEAKAKLTPEQREERKYRHFGGHVYQQQKTKVVSIANEQSLVSNEELAKIADEMQSMLMLPVQINAEQNVALKLRVCSKNEGIPLTLMPENATAIIDTKALSADSPTKTTLENRVSKELWRGFVYCLGGGNTYVQHCVMKPVFSLEDLDAIPSRSACPDAYLMVSETAQKLGIKPARRVTYRQACKEGWAPAPTNDVQKAIWDSVRKLPEKPLTIEFDPAKGK